MSAAPLHRIAIIALILALAACGRKSEPVSTRQQYVDAKVCAGCHPAIAESYKQTGMGRSFFKADTSSMNVEELSAKLFHKPSNRHYQIQNRDGKIFMRRHQLEADGKETNVVEKEIHYVMGSGNHVRSYIHRTPQNRLVEMPLAWYAESKSWQMSPGYDSPHHQDFRRVIGYSCMFCHNAYPQVDVSADSAYATNLPQGIDCQRCHGPGSDHMQAAQSAQPKDKIRASILNPSKLSKARQLEVCMQCHLETTSFPLPNSIQRFERSAFSYKPSEPIGDFFLFFDHEKQSTRQEKFEIVNSVYRLRQSKCFQNTGGNLVCTTCHNPHRKQNESYTSVCLSCHKQAHNATKNCAECHMPKRRTEDVVHAVMTDHKIQRRALANPLAPLQERHEAEGAYQGEVVLYYPPKPPQDKDELYVAIAQVAQKSNTKQGIARLAAALKTHNPAHPGYYFELAQAQRKEDDKQAAIDAYNQALQKDSNFLPALRSLGSITQSTETLQKAASLYPNDASSRHELAKALQSQGKFDEAVAQVKEALKLDPDFVEAHQTLGNFYLEKSNVQLAEASYREAIRLRPDFAEAHDGLANVLAARNDFAQAEQHFQTALIESPQNANIHFNYGNLLLKQARLKDAQRELELTINHNPNLPEAHDILGDITARLGDWQSARKHYQEALRLRPGFDRALLGLGTAYGALGDLTSAKTYLTQAARSTNPQIQNEAIDLMRKTGLLR